MLDQTAKWIFSDAKPLTQWYGHVHLLSEHAVGQWLCVNRKSGQLLWRSEFWRPNTFCGVDSDVIVASEMRSDGPWTATFGCYGISLKSGTLIWTSHGSGMRGILLQIFDYLPGYTNGLRDSPHHLKNGKVFCNSGRVLNVTTGQLLEKADSPDTQFDKPPRRIDEVFYNSTLNKEQEAISIGGGIFLRHLRQVESGNSSLEIMADTEAGENIWSFSTNVLGRKFDGNFYSHRLMPPYLYLIVSDQDRFRPNPAHKNQVLPNPTYWHFVAVDLRNGNVAQDFSLCDQKLEECRIEDVDDRGLLIGRSNQTLAYYERIPTIS